MNDAPATHTPTGTAVVLCYGFDFAHLGEGKVYPNAVAARRAFCATHRHFASLGNVSNVVGTISPVGHVGPAVWICGEDGYGRPRIERNKNRRKV